MDKFTIKRTLKEPVAFKPIQIRMSTYDMICRIREETGASIVDLLDAMVNFCAERLNVIDE